MSGCKWQASGGAKEPAVATHSSHVDSRMLLPRDPGGSSPKAPRITYPVADVWGRRAVQNATVAKGIELNKITALGLLAWCCSW